MVVPAWDCGEQDGAVLARWDALLYWPLGASQSTQLCVVHPAGLQMGSLLCTPNPDPFLLSLQTAEPQPAAHPARASLPEQPGAVAAVSALCARRAPLGTAVGSPGGLPCGLEGH